LVSADLRLAGIIESLESVGVSCLVMGGHAARYYGVQRTTVDFDLHLAPSAWDTLELSLGLAGLSFRGRVIEGNSWRPDSFRRFQIGTLFDGREEWLEFWRENHLLPPFEDVFARRELGFYGGRQLPFLSLTDLIRSKETERASDWQDIDLLEEVQDQRNLAAAADQRLPVATALAELRTRIGLERAVQDDLLVDRAPVSAAISQTRSAITQALLLPFDPAAILPPVIPAIEPVVLARLRSERSGSSLHLALVEAVRRQYRHWAQARDREGTRQKCALGSEDPASRLNEQQPRRILQLLDQRVAENRTDRPVHDPMIERQR
jgi:hypothetical protein